MESAEHETLPSVEKRGTKRARSELAPEAPGSTNGHCNPSSVHGILTPRELSQCPTPMSGLEFFDDDRNEDHEWIRIPKRRDFNIFQAAKVEPEVRNKANVALTAVTHEGKKVTMWAKMDTGAEQSCIYHATLKALLGPQIEDRMRPIAEEQLVMLGGKHIEVTHCVDLDFWAGVTPKHFERVNFIVVPDHAKKSQNDGMPNLLLSRAFLLEHSMLMIDLEYCHDADPGLPVIATRADDEDHGAVPILIHSVLKYPTRPGIKRPR